MKLNVTHLNVPAITSVDSWVAKQIAALADSRRIDEAHLRVVRLPDASPAYQVQAHLVTPGPDVHAESRDHTLRAAFTKVISQLRSTITGRAAKRMKRIKGHRSARRQG